MSKPESQSPAVILDQLKEILEPDTDCPAADTGRTQTPQDEAWLSTALLDWFNRCGRHDLPWQSDPSPYRVWVSEIMLQQTQVVTVIPYYRRFMQRFPDVQNLADATPDEVLHLWTGLGYYARARNLHRTARLICEQYQGCFPLDLETLLGLPGIGRSTAGAILSMAAGQRHAILDGNVKRVLARVHAVAGWLESSQVEKQLWLLAEAHTPAARVAAYTQAIMDLGATVCTRTRPACARCPLAPGCLAHVERRETFYPTPKPRRALPQRATLFLMLQNEHNEILLQQRPPAGIWGGLWGFPEVPSKLRGAQLQQWCREQLGYCIERMQYWPALRHSFSHFHLDITPVLAQVNPAGSSPSAVMEAPAIVWYNNANPGALGLAAPVKHLLELLSHPSENTT